MDFIISSQQHILYMRFSLPRHFRSFITGLLSFVHNIVVHVRCSLTGMLSLSVRTASPSCVDKFRQNAKHYGDPSATSDTTIYDLDKHQHSLKQLHLRKKKQREPR